MTGEYEFLLFMEEFPPGGFRPSRHATFEEDTQGDPYKMDLALGEGLIPANGRFPQSHWSAKLSFHQKSRGATTEVGPDQSVFEAQAELASYRPNDICAFYLRPLDREEMEGPLRVTSNLVPEKVDEEGDTCYVTLTLEYEHELTKSSNDWSEEETKRRGRSGHGNWKGCERPTCDCGGGFYGNTYPNNIEFSDPGEVD